MVMETIAEGVSQHQESTPVDMKIDKITGNTENQKNKRNISQTQDQQAENTREPNNKEQNERAIKRPFLSHGIRRAKRKVRFDFLNAKNTVDAYNKWQQILTILRKIDTTTIIHTEEPDVAIHITEPLPTYENIKKYTKIEGIQKRNGDTKYGCITTITTARPIYEIKKLRQELVDVLIETNTYLKGTTLETVDTVEIGFFLGLHPSLTNIEWRTEQIRSAIGVPTLLPKFQLYRRQLQEGEAKTTCIVLSCAKPEAKILQTKLMQINQHALGKNVEFVPYQLRSVWPLQDYQNLFYQQNQYIQDVGAIAIQGITRDYMQYYDEEEKVTVQQFLLSHEKILSIEKSNTPTINKWWIMIKKEDTEEITKYLNTDMVRYMQTIQPVGTKTPYTPPKNIETNTFTNAESNQQVQEFSKILKQRIKIRPTPGKILQTPPSTGRQRQTYAQVTAKHPRMPQTPPVTEVVGKTQEQLEETQETLNKLTEAVSTIHTKITETSSLTPSIQQEHITSEIQKSSEQQIKTLANEMKAMMQNMMSQFMQTITNLITTLIPTILRSINPTQLNPGNIQMPVTPMQVQQGNTQNLGQHINIPYTPVAPTVPNITPGGHLSTAAPMQTV